MKSGITFSPEKAESAIRSARPWNWLITSGRQHAEVEERRIWSTEHFSELQQLKIRRVQSDTPHRFLVSTPSSDKQVPWNELGPCLAEFIPVGASILLDATHLGFDALLYLLPALRVCAPMALACLYVAPLDFHEIEANSLEVQDTLPISQPRGFVALTGEETRGQSRHIILLGFDKGRPWKFIQRYDWDEAHLHLVVGDPPFVEGGVEAALTSCEPWVDSFRKAFPKHIHGLDAREPEAVRAFLGRQLAEVRWLDIVPLGPKPMLLGVLAFYFGLPDDDRARVRLLYDFSEQRARRCNGVQTVYFWDWASGP